MNLDFSEMLKQITDNIKKEAGNFDQTLKEIKTLHGGEIKEIDEKLSTWYKVALDLKNTDTSEKSSDEIRDLKIAEQYAFTAISAINSQYFSETQKAAWEATKTILSKFRSVLVASLL